MSPNLITGQPEPTPSPTSNPYPVTPYQPPPDTGQVVDPVTLAEQGAQSIFQASMAAYGQPPNPQLAAEAIQSNSTSLVAGSFSDPTLMSYAVQDPTGTGAAPSGPQNGPGQPGSTLDQFNWNQYWQYMHTALQHNEAWQRFGEIPQLNFGYIEGVLGAPGDSVRKWQTMLMDRGFLDQQHGSTSSWDDASKQSLQNFYVAMAMPQALYGKDNATKVQASLFLHRLGIDPVAIQSQSANDPSFQTKLVESWSMTQGPQRQRDALHDYIDQFGAENVPKSIRDIVNPGLLGTIGQGLFSLATALPDLAGTAISPITGGENKVANFLNQASPAHLEAQDVSKQLTDADKQLLAPAISQLQQSSGFLPFQWWDQKKNDVILSMKYSIEDAFTGHGSVNPLDALDVTSSIGQRVGQHHDDIMAGLFGDQWVKDHPEMAKWGGMAANILDDPITWATLGASAEVTAPAEAEAGVTKLSTQLSRPIGVAGLASRAPGAALSVTRLGVKNLADESGFSNLSLKARNAIRDARSKIPGLKTLEPLTMKDAASPGLSNIMSKWIAPRASAEAAITSAIIAAREADDIDTVLHLTRMSTGNHMADEGLVASVHKMMDPKTDAHEVRRILQDDFAHTMLGTQGLYNMISGLQTMAPEVMRRLGQGGLSRARALGGFRDAGVELDHTNEGVVETMDTMKNQLATAGMAYKDIAPLMSKYYRLDVSGRGRFIGEVFKPTLAQAIKVHNPGMTIADVMSDSGKWNRGRSFVQFQNPELASELGAHGKIKQVSFLPSPSGPVRDITEQSLVRSKPQYILEAINSVKGEIDQAMTEGKAKARMEMPGISDEEAAQHFLKKQGGTRLINSETKKLNVLQNYLDEESLRPGPGVEGQQQQASNLDFTTYELAASLHKKLNNYEDLAATVRADALNSIWKGLALARPSTAARIMVGDDNIRAVAELINKGQIVAAIRVAVSSTLRGLQVGFHIPGAKKYTAREDVRAIRETLLKGRVDNLDFLKYINEQDPHHFAAWVATDPGYATAFKQMNRVFQNSPSVVAWAKAEAVRAGTGKVALRGIYEKQSPSTQEIISKSGTSLDQYAEKMDDYLKQWFRNPTVLDMFVKKKIEPNVLADLIKNHKDELPHVSAPKQTAAARNIVTRALKGGPSVMFHAIAEPMIASARGEIYRSMKADYDKHIAKAHPDWSPERVSNIASGEAMYWMKNNLYQGQRSLAGRALRHAFPFGGATANMGRFWLRQAKMHPYIVEPGARSLSSAEASAQGGKDKSTWLGGNILSALGFSGQDALTANLAHSLFLSADGVASFVPGFGPVFSPLMSWVDNNQMLKDELSSIPGIGEQLSYAQGGPSFVPSWIGRDVNAVSEAALGTPDTLPGIGVDPQTEARNIDDKYKQLYADFKAGKMDHEPTRDDAIRSLGREQTVSGALGAVAPVTPSIVDARRQEISAAAAERQGAQTPAALDAVIAAHPKIAPFLKYMDPRTPLDSEAAIKAEMAKLGTGATRKEAIDSLGPSLNDNKDQIVKDNPWVIPYATSITESDIAKPVGLSEYDQALALGNLHLLGVDEMQSKINKSYDFNSGWMAYNNNVVALEQNFLAANGVTRNSQEFKDFSAQTIAPILKSIADNNPNWATQFLNAKSKPTSALGLQHQAEPLSSLQAWEVIPQHSSLETPQTVLWRKTLVLRDSAAAEIAGLTAQGASSDQKDQVMQYLQDQLGQLAAQDPIFAAQLKLYNFSKIEDVVNAEAKTGSYGSVAIGNQ